MFCLPEHDNVINQDKLCVAMMAPHNDILFKAKKSAARVDKTRHWFLSDLNFEADLDLL